MSLEVGAVVEGRVTAIAKFGAFVALEGGRSGLVHISELANSFVSDVSDHVQVGQAVRVRVLSIGQDGKINLSIKRALEPETPRPQRVSQQPRTAASQSAARAPMRTGRSVPSEGAVNTSSGDQDFEDRLKRFMQESDSRIADNRMYAERPRKNRRK